MPQKAPPHAFKPGQSGNPNGRPKSTLNKTLAKLLANKCPGRTFTNEEAVCRVVVELAKEGDKDMINFIWDRIVGKPLQTLSSDNPNVPMFFTLSLGDSESKA